MAPHGRWWSYAADLLAIQLLGVAALLGNVGALLRRDRVLRRARAQYRAQLVELSAAAPALILLDRTDFAEVRAIASVDRLRHAEAALKSQHDLSNAVAPAMTALALGALVVRPHSAALWLVVAALLALSTFDSLSVVRDALDTAVAVNGAAERLEELEESRPAAGDAWPSDTTIRLEHVAINEGGTALVHDATFTVAPGRKVAIIGASGVGKSTLLRAMAALDDVAAGSISVGECAVRDVNEGDLRRLVAYLASEPGLTRGYALDVVRLGRDSTRDAFADLASLGLSADATTRWTELSRGERARVAVVRAMVTSPVLFLLDEPTSGLGSSETAAVLSLLATTGATIVVATHDPHVMAWCDEVLELIDGTLRELRR
jgi:ATP-binding cassette subfamily C protein/ATP-binding cassette subfamily C protein CydC